MSASYVQLPRDVVALNGADCRSFLQGLVSQDMERVSETMSVYSALLTPQGKYLHDFFVMTDGARLWIDCEAGRADDLIQRLSRFRLRADAQFENSEDMAVFAVFGPEAPKAMGLDANPGFTRVIADTLAYTDPRDVALGCRLLGNRLSVEAVLNSRGIPETDFTHYDALRISLEIPDGSRDMEVEKSTLLESNFDRLNGIDWEKGCYIGQELTARTKYRGLVKRQLSAFRATHERQIAGEPVFLQGQNVGEIRSRCGDHLLVSIRIDALGSDDGKLAAAGNPLNRP